MYKAISSFSVIHFYYVNLNNTFIKIKHQLYLKNWNNNWCPKFKSHYITVILQKKKKITKIILFLKFFYLLIHFILAPLSLLAACGLSLGAASGAALAMLHGLPIAMASLVAEPGL